MLHISDNKVMIYQMPLLILEFSGNKRSIVPGCDTFCLMTIPCKCVLIINEIAFQSLLSQCESQR